MSRSAIIQMRLSIWSVSQFGSQAWFTNAAMPKPSMIVSPSSMAKRYVTSVSAYIPSHAFAVSRGPVYSRTRVPFFTGAVVQTPAPCSEDDLTIRDMEIPQHSRFLQLTFWRSEEHTSELQSRQYLV